MADPVITQELVEAYGWKATPAALAFKLSRYDNPHPSLHWQPARHLRLLSDLIFKAVHGIGPRFNIISMPPRHGKSWLVSKWTPVWYLENFPYKQVMNCGYGSQFASEWGGAVRNEIGRCAPMLSFSLSEDSKAKNRWKTDQDGGMVSAGIGSGITGRGADLLIVDDPIKDMEEANSPLIRDKIWDWWTSTARTRLHPGGCIFIVMTRWHEDDLAGRLLSPEYGGDSSDADVEKWNVINLPYIYDQQAAKDGPDPLGRKVGGILWPERNSAHEAKQTQHDTSEEKWEALYQGRPANRSTKGNVYSSYNGAANAGARLERDPDLPLFWALDFNRDPMCSVVGQYRETNTARTILTNEKLVTLEVLQELALPDCGTLDACHEFVARAKEYVNLARGRSVRLEIFGDASGNQRSTNGDETDWQIIKTFFRRYPEFRITYYIEKANPPVKSRTNAVNLALKDAAGFRRLFVDVGCIELKKDFAVVKWKRDQAGNTLNIIDKDDKKRTHLSDALGYVVVKKFGVRSIAGEQDGLMR